ncbi:MAG TPA: DUF4340 domain-containing protein [Acidobacteriota bacterium]|nr:DUF4340 domain-containing protein [Acidobacteriota bacterium]
MNFRKTLVLLAVLIGLLAVVLFFDSRGAKKKAAEEKTNTLIDLKATDVQKVSLLRGAETVTLEREGDGPWRLTAPLQAAADTYEAGSLVDALASLRIERVVEKEGKDPAAYEIPKIEADIWVKGKDAPVRLLVGMENPLDKSLFAKRADDPRIVLLASTLKSTLEKPVLDLREKSVFKFTAADVQKVRVRAKDIAWEADRAAAGWFLKTPVAALAEKTKIDSLLDSLSGLRATAFAAEEKTPAALKEFGLEKPDYEVALALPASNQEIVFTLHKQGEKQYAASSLATKIIAFEGTLLADLDRKVDDLREKKVSDLTAWDAKRVTVRRDGTEIAAAKEKVGEEEKWLLDPAAKVEADGTKVEDFVRKIEGLEAAAFIDKPGPLADYGLAPGIEVRVLTRDYQNTEKETVLFIGREDPEKKQVVVKNAALDYLFRVDAAFLQDLPKEKKNWQAAAPKPEEKTDKK